MGGHQQPGDPAAYSTQIDGNYSSGYSTTGYKKIIISPDQLDGAIKTLRGKLDGQDPTQLAHTLVQAVLDESAFGNIPHADTALQQVTQFVTDHTEQMNKMGSVLADFIARVQAAAQLGYEADPVTRQRAAFARAHERME